MQQQLDREAEHPGAEAEDQQELDQVVDREAEEAVEVAGLEERLRRAGAPTRGSSPSFSASTQKLRKTQPLAIARSVPTIERRARCLDGKVAV